MALLQPERIAQLLQPFYPDASHSGSAELLAKLSSYLDLLVKWNARTNLTAIRGPEEIVGRHFGESLSRQRTFRRAGHCWMLALAPGFPGLPIALVRPDVRVMLAESQNKKAAFLREAVRLLGVKVEVWAARVETMPAARLFDVVALRAVDRPAEAIAVARSRLAPGGFVLQLTSRDDSSSEGDASGLVSEVSVPGGETRVLRISR